MTFPSIVVGSCFEESKVNPFHGSSPTFTTSIRPFIIIRLVFSTTFTFPSLNPSDIVAIISPSYSPPYPTKTRRRPTNQPSQAVITTSLFRETITISPSRSSSPSRVIRYECVCSLVGWSAAIQFHFPSWN